MSTFRRNLIATACWAAALVVTVILWLLSSAEGWPAALWLVTLAWAVLTWKRAQVWRYDNGISQRPSTLVLVFVIFGWPLFFPWYLAMRLKIWLGVAQLLEGSAHHEFGTNRPRSDGLVQHWRGHRL